MGESEPEREKRDRCYATDILNKLLKRWGGGECMHARAHGGGGEEMGGGGEAMPHAHVFLQFRGMACLETVSLPAEFGTKVFVFSVQLLLVLLHLSLEAGLHLKCRQGRETSATGTHTHTHPSQQHTNSDKWQCCPISPSKQVSI